MALATETETATGGRADGNGAKTGSAAALEDPLHPTDELSLFKYAQLQPLPDDYRDLDEAAYRRRMEAVRAELGDDVVILGHNYQNWNVNRYADHLGDSYGLSKLAADAEAGTIVFCGVTFMAETAAILARDDQRVVIPNMEAACPMAGMAEMVQVRKAWEALDAVLDDPPVPVAYMNTYADLKAFTGRHGGTVCTSSNAEAALRWAFDRGGPDGAGGRVLFLPDRYLGENTALDMGVARDALALYDPWQPGGGVDPERLRDSRVILWEGFCQVHERFRADHVRAIRRAHPDATVIVHPECRREVVEDADETGSTAQIIDHVASLPAGATVAVGTEVHLVRRLAREHPDKAVLELCGEACMDCNAMRQIEPPYLLWCLEELAAGRVMNEVTLDDDVKVDARLALERMLAL